MATRYVIGFGYEFTKEGKRSPTFGRDDGARAVAALVQAIAEANHVRAYSLRFGPGARRNPDTGQYVIERGGTIEIIDDVTAYRTIRRFAEELRDALEQDCVVYYRQPVEFFGLI